MPTKSVSVSVMLLAGGDISGFLSLGLFKLRIPVCFVCLLKMGCCLQSLLPGEKKKHMDHMSACGTQDL